MKFKDILLMCLRNLTKRKARTFLTVSGVTIGTCAIIVMISLGVGMTQAQEAMMSEWADLTLVEVYRRGDVDAVADAQNQGRGRRDGKHQGRGGKSVNKEAQVVLFLLIIQPQKHGGDGE